MKTIYAIAADLGDDNQEELRFVNDINSENKIITWTDDLHDAFFFEKWQSAMDTINEHDIMLGNVIEVKSVLIITGGRP